MKGINRLTLGFVAITVFFAAPALAVSITNISFIPPSPAAMDFGELVSFSFDYEVDQESRIYGRPFDDGALRLDYSAHPSPLYPIGTGSSSGYFTILDLGQGVAYVDQVRFQVFASDNVTLLNEQFVSVDYVFGRVPAPEPATFLMLSVGLLAIAGSRSRKRRR